MRLKDRITQLPFTKIVDDDAVLEVAELDDKTAYRLVSRLVRTPSGILRVYGVEVYTITPTGIDLLVDTIQTKAWPTLDQALNYQKNLEEIYARSE